MIPDKELINLLDTFINENGLWTTFKEFVENQGYTLSELGFQED